MPDNYGFWRWCLESQTREFQEILSASSRFQRIHQQKIRSGPSIFVAFYEACFCYLSTLWKIRRKCVCARIPFEEFIPKLPWDHQSCMNKVEKKVDSKPRKKEGIFAGFPISYLFLLFFFRSDINNLVWLIGKVSQSFREKKKFLSSFVGESISVGKRRLRLWIWSGKPDKESLSPKALPRSLQHKVLTWQEKELYSIDNWAPCIVKVVKQNFLGMNVLGFYAVIPLGLHLCCTLVDEQQCGWTSRSYQIMEYALRTNAHTLSITRWWGWSSSSIAFVISALLMRHRLLVIFSVCFTVRHFFVKLFDSFWSEQNHAHHVSS